MKLNRFIVILGIGFLLGNAIAYAKTMIVRVYVKNYEQLSKRIDFKFTNIEIAGAKPNESYDLIVESEDYPVVIASGLRNEIVTEDLEKEKEDAMLLNRYISLDSINIYLRNYTSTYPSICVLDSLGLSYENRQMYGIKISDNPSMSEPEEPGVFFCGLHHAREWATYVTCLSIADSFLRAYSTAPEIQSLINNHEIWIFPVINPDGYYYDYPNQRSWRKNRQPFGGSIGTDLNRNYNGACNGERMALWGALTSGAQSSHTPSSETFMGSYGASSPEITNVINFFRTHNINVSLSFHSYSELVLWPWGYQNVPTPDNAIFVRVGTRMANMIQKVSGGTYTPEQSTSLYPVSSGCDDWIYGWNRALNGVPCLTITNEIGTSFYQSTSQLDQIWRQNFKAAYYLATFSDSVRILMKGMVPPPQISVPETSLTGNFTVVWQPKNPQFNTPNLWEIQELKDYSIFTDSFEVVSSAWVMQGFQRSIRRPHSGIYSMYSDSANNISNYVRTVYPYLVQVDDSLSFWCWYNLEKNYDVAVAEVSYDTREWFQLGARMTDTAMSWRRKAYSLEPYAGKSIYIQFRVMTDGSVLKNGFYLDDVYPVPMFDSSRIVSSTIADTFCNISVPNTGQYWYRVKGSNISNGWGEYSILDDVTVLSSSIVENSPNVISAGDISCNIFPNPFSNTAVIRYSIPNESKVIIKIYDVQGRNVTNLINSVHKPGVYQIVWDGKKILSTGRYFLQLNVGKVKLTKRLTILK